MNVTASRSLDVFGSGVMPRKCENNLTLTFAKSQKTENLSRGKLQNPATGNRDWAQRKLAFSSLNSKARLLEVQGKVATFFQTKKSKERPRRGGENSRILFFATN